VRYGFGQEFSIDMERDSYHHGRLPEALLEAAAKLIADQGVANLSLREVARRAGVSHGAPAHHFTDKAGVLTALAAQGFSLFTAALCAARDAAGGDALARLAATGRAYVRFAVEHRAHFEVMFRPELLRREDPALHAAQAAAYAVLGGAIGAAQAAGYVADGDVEVLAVRAWSEAHGLAVLWLSGNLRASERYPDLESLVTAVFAGGPELAQHAAPSKAAGKSKPGAQPNAEPQRGRGAQKRSPLPRPRCR
jgi:AcrR family transcriptional regulator